MSDSDTGRRPVRMLDEATVRLIAAGEVINRPASAVKELIENSLDAGATDVRVELKAGGKNLVRVVDNGHGMSRDDLRLAVTRHATSKIGSIDDLARLASFGFRGEALASIAAVSRMSIETTIPNAEIGTRIEVEGGDVRSIAESPHPKGTSVTVGALFYNLPARRSFVRSEGYEVRLCLQVVREYACGRPDVGFEVVSEGRSVLRTPPVGSLRERLRELYDRRLVEGLVDLNVVNPVIGLTGSVTDPTQARPHYEFQHIYFNGRPVKSRVVTRAVYEGCGPALMNNHPSFVAFLTTDSARLDVNIHPAKSEVKFADERYLFDFVSEATRQAIGTSRRGEPGAEEFVFQRAGPTGDEGTPQNFWQLHNSYIMAQVTTGYVIVDQHAAHERVLYEELTTAKDRIARQGLLFPISLELTAEQYATYERMADDLSRLGLEIRPFGPSAVAVEAVPAGAYLGKAELEELFAELADLKTQGPDLRPALVKAVACKGAVRFGQRLGQAEMESLINRLFACREPYVCPHGRPAIIRVTSEELARRFGRQ